MRIEEEIQKQKALMDKQEQAKALFKMEQNVLQQEIEAMMGEISSDKNKKSKGKGKEKQKDKK